MRIIVDSIDKRMTAPLIDYLTYRGFEVHGICFSSDLALNSDKLKKIHYIDKAFAFDKLKTVLSGYTKEDIIIAGNPVIIKSINDLKPDIKYLLSSFDSIQKASNKKELQVIADSIGVKMPKKLLTPCFPLIVKLNVSENTTLKPSERYKIIKEEKDFVKAMPFIKENQGNFIMQEYVDGVSTGVSMLLDKNSNLVDYIIHERLLEYPVSGGPSAACKSIESPDLAHISYKILKALKWKGLAMVEFKGDYLIEINPRFWGSMPLIFIAGSDFFGNYIKILQSQSTVINPDQIKYRPDKIMFFFPQAILSVIDLLKSKNFTKAAAGLKAVFLGKEGLFRFKNLKPFFKYLILLVKKNSR